MAFKEGDFLEVEYSAWDAATNDLIATTDEKLAKEKGIFNKDSSYGPTLVILGSNSVIKGLDRELRGMNLNEMKKFTFKPEDAFGSRHEELVRVMPLSDFRARELNPYPGMRVEVENMAATVKSVNSGRVVVDANHPYAGRDITYEVRIVGNITEPAQRVEALGKTYNVKPSSVSMKGKEMVLSYDSKTKKNADYFVGKSSLVASILSLMKDIDKVEVQEDYERAEIAKESEPKKAADGKD
ncbi:MAG: peptidylprolyl isomerase [Candidatus Marsarchaeota archaeon]|jgi:FKBP-type peptidyl-prolyl cis-trans isomerase 2|nr:peptidylprolyl isomerase [Candidatus Marsarchaeota archaeon]MCL5111545.1 peptidylprolyl isomerase [Candidatus Marsarchaeota archaeon]